MKLTRIQESRIKRNLNQSSNFPTDINEIEQILNDLEIVNYTINNDGTVDVDGNVDVSGYFRKYGNKFPIQFGTVSGNFCCYWNKLISLEGAPHMVGGDFNCTMGKITSLEGSPKEVGGYFDCGYNSLTSLKGAPKEVGGDFRIYDNPNLTSLKGAPQKVGGDFSTGSNKIEFTEDDILAVSDVKGKIEFG